MFLIGRFGNHLWEVSAGIKFFGEDNFKVNHRFCGRFENKCFKNGIRNIESKEETSDEDYLLMPSYYQHKRYLVEPCRIIPYIDPKPKDIESYPCVLHLRLDDYLQSEPYKSCVITPQYFRESVKSFGMETKDVWVMSDGTEEQVRNHLQTDDINFINEPDQMRAFWTMQNSLNLICSASTFSYWAAYLKTKGDVRFPKLWPCDILKNDMNNTMAVNSRTELLWF